jgi:hypothetical protein
MAVKYLKYSSLHLIRAKIQGAPPLRYKRNKQMSLIRCQRTDENTKILTVDLTEKKPTDEIQGALP